MTMIECSGEQCPRRPERNQTGAVGIGNPDDAHPTVASFRRIAFMTLFMIVFVVIPLVGIGLVATVRASDNSDRVAQGTQIASCRSQAHLPVDAANDREQSLILLALGASDRAAYLAALQLDPPMEIARAKQKAQGDYEAAVKRAVSDPTGFLRACRVAR